MEQNYTINDIETLSFKDGVRQRIAMYLGSADMQGVYNAIQEIISNSIDEYYMGYGNEIGIGLCHNELGWMITVTEYEAEQWKSSSTEYEYEVTTYTKGRTYVSATSSTTYTVQTLTQTATE